MSRSDYDAYKKLFPAVLEYQELASKYNIRDIFQDNGGKYLQLLLVLKLHTDGRREGNDAFDEDGNEFEIKTVNVALTASFSTHHHLNPVILKKYRSVDWFFAVYEGIELKVVYRLKPATLEPYFTSWQKKLKDQNLSHINNPKIPVAFVHEVGEIVWLPDGVEKNGYPVPKRSSLQGDDTKPRAAKRPRPRRR